jgi:putative ABC transport system permease protein
MDLEILPLLGALRRNKIGAALIVLQIAVTLAIVSNSLSMIQHRVRWMERPSGIDEANSFALHSTWAADRPDLKARIAADLAALRSLPGVIDAEATNSTPLIGDEWAWPLAKKSNQQDYGAANAWAAVYAVDEHGLATFGLNLIAGRWFTASEVGEIRIHETHYPPVIVITLSVARALFPHGDALGQVLYYEHSGRSSRIVGIVQMMQRPSDPTGWGNPDAENSVFVPSQFVDKNLAYVVRTKPGLLAAMMQAVPVKLHELTAERTIEAVKSFSEMRREAHRDNRVTVIMLGVLSALLLAVTAFGVVGLTTYWVTQRRRYIGMRRALGATRLDILRYFHTENLLIAGLGCVLGAILGLAANTWVAFHTDLTRMSGPYMCVVALVVLALCQAATLLPAFRASIISPASAARGL